MVIGSKFFDVMDLRLDEGVFLARYRKVICREREGVSICESVALTAVCHAHSGAIFVNGL